MKISQVLDYLKIECVLRGDKDYRPDIDVSDLPLQILDGKSLDNATFHAAAKTVGQQLDLAMYARALQNLLDETAREKGYDDAQSCASYATSNNPNWKAEALLFIAWRDDAWAYAIDVQTSVEQGQQAPTLDEFLAGVPDFNWS